MIGCAYWGEHACRLPLDLLGRNRYAHGYNVTLRTEPYIRTASARGLPFKKNGPNSVHARQNPGFVRGDRTSIWVLADNRSEARLRGKLTGRWPDGLTRPVSTSAMASPPAVPGNHASTSAPILGQQGRLMNNQGSRLNGQCPSAAAYGSNPQTAQRPRSRLSTSSHG